MTDSTSGLDPEALLAHTAWVRALARAVAGRPDQVDDVVQETWRAAIETPPRHATNLRGWLGRVVVNAARQLGRGEARRARRELAVGPAAGLPVASELLEEAELQRAVVSAVLALEEPYRSTVLLRFYRDRSPAEIAALQGVPAATVRSRLHRALEQLRPRLADRRPAVAVPVIGWSAKALAGAAALALAAWSLVPPSRSAPDGDALVGVPSPAPRDPDERPPDGAGRELAAAAGERTTRVPVSPAPEGDRPSAQVAAEPTTGVHGQVRAAETGEPLEGASVAWSRGTLVTGPDGRYRIPDAVVGPPLWLAVSAPGRVTEQVLVRLPDFDPLRRDVALQRGVPIDVTVFDATTGAPLREVEVRCSDRGAPPLPVDGRGRFTVHVADGTELSLEVAAPGYASLRWGWDVQDAARAPRCRIPMVALGWIDGIVVDESGTPLPGRSVFADCDDDRGIPGRVALPPEERAANGLFGWARYEVPDAWEVQTDEQGRFTVPVMPGDAPFDVHAGGGESVPTTVGPIRVQSPGQRAWARVVLRAGATLGGRVLCNGKPWFRGELSWEHASGTRGGSATADLDGRYELTHVPPGEVRVRARLDGRTVCESSTMAVVGGGSYELDLVWEEETGTIGGRVTDARGAPVVGQVVRASCETSGGHLSFRTSTYDDGCYELDVLLPHSYRIAVSHGPHREARDDVPPGSEGIDFALPDLGTLRLSFVDAESLEPVSIEESWLRALAWRRTGEEAFRAQSDVLELVGHTIDLELPVGTVDLSLFLSADGYAPARIHDVPVSAGEPGAPFVVRLARGVEVKLRLEPRPMTAAERRGRLFFLLEESELASVRGPYPTQGGPSNHKVGGVCMWLGEPGLLEQMVHFDEAGAALRKGLAPGRYGVRYYPDDYAFAPETFEVGKEGAVVELGWSPR